MPDAEGTEAGYEQAGSSRRPSLGQQPEDRSGTTRYSLEREDPSIMNARDQDAFEVTPVFLPLIRIRATRRGSSYSGSRISTYRRSSGSRYAAERSSSTGVGNATESTVTSGRGLTKGYLRITEDRAG